MNMKRVMQLILVALSFYSYTVHAADMRISCEEPQGSRIDYFTQNSAHLTNETFLQGRDRVTGMSPKILLNTNNQDVYFEIGDAANTSAQENRPSKSGKMKVLAYNDDQISFTGVVNGAPVMGTYYPRMKILIYSQQSTWPGAEFVGARAMLFYSKCSEN